MACSIFKKKKEDGEFAEAQVGRCNTTMGVDGVFDKKYQKTEDGEFAEAQVSCCNTTTGVDGVFDKNKKKGRW